METVCCCRHLRIDFLVYLPHRDNGKHQLWYTFDSIILRILVRVGDWQSSASNRIIVGAIGHRVGRTAWAGCQPRDMFVKEQPCWRI